MARLKRERREGLHGACLLQRLICNEGDNVAEVRCCSWPFRLGGQRENRPTRSSPAPHGGGFRGAVMVEGGLAKLPRRTQQRKMGDGSVTCHGAIRPCRIGRMVAINLAAGTDGPERNASSLIAVLRSIALHGHAVVSTKIDMQEPFICDHSWSTSIARSTAAEGVVKSAGDSSHG